ncbi:MAG: DUF4012 domain-containing protein [Candidatus Falkowbacteria bacterium]
MSKNKKQLNINNSSRDLRSSFVVDLRKRAVQEIKQIEKKEKKVAKQVIKEIEYLENKSQKIKPNLLHIGQGTISLPKKNRFSFFDFKFIRRHSSKSNSPWDKFYSEQIAIFKKASKYNHKSGRDLIEQTRRAENAEEKVIWYRSILSFVIVLILIIVPLKLLSFFEFLDLSGLENKILGSSQLAINNLMAATNAVTKMDLKDADTEFQNAGNNFLAAQEQLNKINDSILSLAALSGDPKLKLAAESKKFLRAGAIASSFGSNLVLATDSLFGSNKESFSVSLDKFTYYGELAVVDANKLQSELEKVNPENLPSEYRDKFISITEQADLLTKNLESFVSAGAKLKNVLGATKDKRYLLVFQNNSELRASGGFLGSYALVDIRDGKIRNLEVPGGGSYDTEGGMNVRVVAPKPLWLVNPLWHFWDANWWPNWPTTAKNLMWFYEKSDGPTVDGVISVTPTVVERLLEITGPIDLTKEYGITIDANNFWETVQKIVEQKNLALTNPEAIIGVPASSTIVSSSLPIRQGLEENSDNKPKKIIGDLMAKILETLPQKLNKDSLVQILALFEESMAEKQVLFYFTDPSLQAEVSRRNWAGEVKDTNRDYLMLINTNIAGQKSDRMMREKIEHKSEVKIDGAIINTVTITRAHTGVKNEAMTGVRNVDWIRVYVPKGSELLSAEGFGAPDEKYFNEKPEADWTESEFLEKENRALVDENSGTKVYEENNKTVFANWLMVDPAQTAVVVIKYRLPFNFLDQAPKSDWLSKINSLLNPDQKNLIPYSLMVQKQPGARPSEFESSLSLPPEWPVFWRYPNNLGGDQGWNINDKLNSDKFWSILIEKNN